MIPIIYPLIIINGTHISFIKNSFVFEYEPDNYGELRFDVQDTISLSTVSKKFDHITLHLNQKERWIFKEAVLLRNLYFRCIGVCEIKYSTFSCNHILE